MMKWGCSKRLVAGSICASGTLGQIIPPSILLVLMADAISSVYQKAHLANGVSVPDTVSIADLFACALGPGLLMVFLFIVYQVGIAIFKLDMPSHSPATDMVGQEISAKSLISGLLPPLLLILSVLGFILSAAPT